MKDESVWLNTNQMAQLFGKDNKTIRKHINNALKEELDNSVVAKFATTKKDGKTYTNLFENSTIRSIWDAEKEEYYFS